MGIAERVDKAYVRALSEVSARHSGTQFQETDPFSPCSQRGTGGGEAGGTPAQIRTSPGWWCIGHLWVLC